MWEMNTMEPDENMAIVVACQPQLARVEYHRYSVYMCPVPYFKTEDGELIATGYSKQLLSN
jgi:hypothetical protein